jgi:hypothetical protein
VYAARWARPIRLLPGTRDWTRWQTSPEFAPWLVA